MKESLKNQAGKLVLLGLFLLGCLDFLMQEKLRGAGVGVENKGVSFGAFQGIDGVLLAVIWIFLLVVTIRSARRQSKNILPMLLMVIGGGVNLLMRARFGGVWDYIRVPLVGLWFNISDMMIVSGIGLFALYK